MTLWIQLLLTNYCFNELSEYHRLTSKEGQQITQEIASGVADKKFKKGCERIKRALFDEIVNKLQSNWESALNKISNFLNHPNG